MIDEHLNLILGKHDVLSFLFFPFGKHGVSNFLFFPLTSSSCGVLCPKEQGLELRFEMLSLFDSCSLDCFIFYMDIGGGLME